MTDLKQIGAQLVKRGWAAFPIRDRRPQVKSWGAWQDRLPTDKEIDGMGWDRADGIGIALPSDLEVVDIDIKNDPGRAGIFGELKSKLPQIIGKCAIQSTANNGYHLIYWSSQSTTEVLAHSAEGRVFVETRGHGSYLAVAPTKGYKFTQGNLSTLQKLTDDERAKLLDVCRAYDRKPPGELPPPHYTPAGHVGQNVWTHYNDTTSALEIAQEYGWNVELHKGKQVHCSRPGGSGDIGANWHTDLNRFHVFTTSADIPPGNYSSSDLLCHYRHKGDKRATANHLFDLFPEFKTAIKTQPEPPKRADRGVYRYDPADAIEEPVCAIKVVGGGQDRKFIPTPGLLTVTGQAGIGKTSILRAIVASMIGGKEIAGFKCLPDTIKGKVYWFETEQPRNIFQRNMKTITDMAGKFDIEAFWLSPCSHRERMAEIDHVIAKEGDRIGMIVVDGWRDLVADINDNTETSELMSKILHWRDDLGILVSGVLHQNPGSTKMRGVIGTEFTNKSDGVVQVDKAEGGSAKVSMGRGRAWGHWSEFHVWFDEKFHPYCGHDDSRDSGTGIPDYLF